MVYCAHFCILGKYIEIFLIKTGDILIAKPFLQDGIFRRSVIYLCEHTAIGSLGFIINKKQGLLLKDIFPHLKNAEFPIFEGGPVSQNQLFYTHTIGSVLKDSLPIKDNVYWGGNFMQLCEMMESGQVNENQIRFYVGYSGWDKNQLKQEINNQEWLTNHTHYAQLIEKDADTLWGEELKKINPRYRVFSDYPFDPSLN